MGAIVYYMKFTSLNGGGSEIGLARALARLPRVSVAKPTVGRMVGGSLGKPWEHNLERTRDRKELMVRSRPIWLMKLCTPWIASIRWSSLVDSQGSAISQIHSATPLVVSAEAARSLMCFFNLCRSMTSAMVAMMSTEMTTSIQPE